VRTADEIVEALDLLGTTRPTAVNLFHAIEMQKRVIGACSDLPNLRSELLASADGLLKSDLEASRTMGALGAGLLGPGSRLLTHCNAGGLATGGLGTALAVFYEAWDRGILERAFADETRPLLQGARLTAWELSRAGIPVTVLPDSAAASLLASGGIDAVFTGADRIAANGDTANKIGTYPLALAAREAGVPFYVVAPLSTFDSATASGCMISIEQRDGAEVAGIQGVRTTPEGVEFHNPAFDVTPARLVTAWICEAGVLGHPFGCGKVPAAAARS
jgi:methylthioribose-1-phosphate isomerase